MRAYLPWLLLLTLALLPWLLLMGLGGLWLWQHGEWLHWLGLAFALSAAAWAAVVWLKKKQASPFSQLPVFKPEQLWSPEADAAWARVEAIADTLDPAHYPLAEPARLLPLAHRLIVEVARRFRPDAKQAELDAPLPSILLIVERVSRDLRELLTEQVPASHLITVEDGLAVWRWKERLQHMATLAGVGRMAVNPLGGLLYELRTAVFGRVTRYPLAQLERWLLQTYARKVGYYAILLYSGQLRPEGVCDEAACPASCRDLETATASPPQEPLRILVAGQTKAGKSSLVNALFGELRAPADALPLTYALTPYRLEQDGELLGLVFDSPGYGDTETWLEKARAELRLIDLVLLVCSAPQAGRAADADFLKRLRHAYAQLPDRIAPPLILVLTHIDQLRPAREWRPPYNLAEPTGLKETHIRQCMDAVSKALDIPLENVQAVCLAQNEEWNIEAVWTSIAAQLPEARRARYLRCLKDAKAREKWELIIRQLGNTGELIGRGIGKLFPK